MTWFVLLLPLLIVVFVGAMLLMMPSLTPATVPLGVNIPRDHIDDPSIAGAVRRYRWGVAGAVVLSVAATAALAAVSPVAAVIVPVLLVLLLSIGAYQFSRRRIQHAKRDGGWYNELPVRLASGISAADHVPVQSPLGWYLGAFVVLAVAAAIGVGLYAGLPDPLPMHWDASGTADAYASKSPMSVFGSLLIGVGLVVFLVIVAHLVRFAPSRRARGESPERDNTVRRQGLLQSMLGQITLVMAVEFAAISAAAWFQPERSSAMPLITVGFLIVIFALIALLMVRMRAVSRASSVSGHEHPSADAPDDDRYWKGGLVYVNRNDPAFLVPKRFGVGWTVNLGHPAGIVVVGALVLLIVGVVVFTATR